MARTCKFLVWSAILTSPVVVLADAGELPTCPAPSLMPNPTFEGTNGLVAGDATGTMPDGWRAFAVAGGAANVEIVPVAAGELYPGSPATRAIRFAVANFTGDQAVDHDNTRVILNSALRYHAEFYIRTGNADNSPQRYRFGFPVFDLNGQFLLREPGAPIEGGSIESTATATWQRVRSRSFMDPEAAYAHISFRVRDDGGDENAILIALPAIIGSTDPVANPGFEYTFGGFPEGTGTINGIVPNDWRLFAVGDAAATCDIVDVAADELYPGSAPTKAVLLQIDAYGTDQGLDLDLARFQMFPGITYQASAYVKTANPDNSNQTFRMQFPIYSGPAYERTPDKSPFLGREPGSTGNLTATSSWQKFTGPAFQDAQAKSGLLAFRVPDDGGPNAILIALPSALPADAANGVPNPEFLGTGGAIVGDVTGAVPDQWRAVAVTGSGDPPVLPNPDFELDAEGTTTPEGNFILPGSIITGWRTFSVNGAGGQMTVTAAAGRSGMGVEIARASAAGDSALDMDAADLRLPIPPQQRVYKALADARDGGVYGGSPSFNIGMQFQNNSANRGASFDPGAEFETYGTTTVSDTGGRISIRLDVGAGDNRSVHVDNVQLIDVTSGLDRMINPGFENSNSRLLGWRFFSVGGTVGSATLSNDAHAGNNAALLEVIAHAGGTDRDIGLDITGNFVAVRPGEQVEVRLFARKVSGDDTRLALDVAGYNNSNVFVTTVADVLLNPSDAAYEEFVVDVTIPNNVTRLNVGLRVRNEAGERTAGAYLIDDVTVTGLTPIDPFLPASAQIAVVPLAADALFPGSPATNAVEWRQTAFGSNDALFDHLNFPFPVMKGRDYRGSVYVKTANSDAADQALDLILQLRRNGETYSTLTIPAVATGTWQKLEFDGIQTLSADSGLFRIRLTDDGGADNAVLVAMPAFELQEPADGLVPNREFAGTGGAVEDAATGETPDRWRVFAVAGAAAESIITPVAANALYAGSPAVNAVIFRRTGFEGDAGLDTHLSRHPLIPNTPYRVSVYARTANTDNTSQTFSFGHPVFVNGATFLGRGPGSFDGLATLNWQLFRGPIFTDPVADTGHVALRINVQDATDDAVMIALPTVEMACPVVTGISPALAATGDVLENVTITGANFHPGLSVRLVQAGQPDIVASNMLLAGEESMTVTFNLAGAASGKWTLALCSGACPPGVLDSAFEVIGCNTPFADVDGDKDVDQDDFAKFQVCITMPNDSTLSFDPINCNCFDRDGDKDVDHDDFVSFALCASGPGIEADPACAD